MITTDIDGVALTAGFITKLQSQSNKPAIRFTFDGSNYDSYVWNVGSIHRDDMLNTGVAVVKVTNSGGEWNTFYSARTNMGKAASVSLYWQGDAQYMPLMTGIVQDVKFRDPDCFIYIADRWASMLKHPLGSGQSPVDFYSGSAYNPLNLIWDILTDYGGLDDTASTANTDIDYTSWDDCRMQRAPLQIKARFTGQKIRSALLSIANLATIVVWVDSHGKFHFAPSFTSGETFSSSTFQKLDLDITLGELVNEYNAYYAYDPDAPGFNSTPEVVDDTDMGGTSQTDFGTHSYNLEDRTVWHTTSASAEQGGIYALTKYNQPMASPIIWCPSFYHYRTDVGDRITLSQTHKGISADEFQITSVDMNVSQGNIAFKGFYI